MNLKKVTNKQRWNYLPIPQWLSKSKKVSFGAQKIYTILYKFLLLGNKIICPKVTTLMEESGLTKSYTIRCIKELESFKLISVERRAGQANTYTLYAPDRYMSRVTSTSPSRCTTGHPVGDQHVTLKVTSTSPTHLLYNKDNKKREEERDSPSVLSIFDHWKEKLGESYSKLDQDRISTIEMALADYGDNDLKLAIDGCANSDWHVENGHTSIDYILGKSDNIEKFIGLAKKDAPKEEETAKEAYDYFVATGRGTAKVARAAIDTFKKLGIDGMPNDIKHHPAAFEIFEEFYNNDPIN